MRFLGIDWVAISPILFLVGWLLLVTVVLPRLGIRT